MKKMIRAWLYGRSIRKFRSEMRTKMPWGLDRDRVQIVLLMRHLNGMQAYQSGR